MTPNRTGHGMAHGGRARWAATTLAAATIGAAGLSAVIAAPPAHAATPATQISAGLAHSCLLRAGKAYCWGENGDGQLGDGNAPQDSSTPVPVAMPAEVTFVEISAGSYHTCAREADGTAWCWGSNYHGQLGNDAQGTDSATPARVAGSHAFSTISAGFFHTCAVDAEHRGWCWGHDLDGQLGNGANAESSDVPSTVHGDIRFDEIDAGGLHTCAVPASSTSGGVLVHCWGYNAYGQLGNGTDDEPSTSSGVPVAVYQDGVLAQASITQLAVAGHNSCVVYSSPSGSGRAACWGANLDGQVGDITRPRSQNAFRPRSAAAGLSFASLSVGASHVCGRLVSGGARCWGDDDFGQIGDGASTATDPRVPSTVTGSEGFSQIDVGDFHSCAISGGIGWCWGRDTDGQVGDDGATSAESTPRMIWLPATAPRDVRASLRAEVHTAEASPAPQVLTVDWEIPDDLAGGNLAEYVATAVDRSGRRYECTADPAVGSVCQMTVPGGVAFTVTVVARTLFAGADPEATVDSDVSDAVTVGTDALPITGTDAAGYVVAAIALVTAGIGLVRFSRRRRPIGD